ncbi:sensor histidine kinase [Nocardia jejuensis]|uniref:sensor histidine kinase n=1 Tax=Nocardia jejuensis TaxID=328049 RepID=UPI00082E59E8|nr:sensor histidine kinase [Nocardia jejuensis]
MLDDSDASEASIARRRRLGWVFAWVWSVYLVDPLRQAAQLEQPVARWYTLAVIVAFGLCYLGSYWLLLRSPDNGASWPSPQWRIVVGPVAAMSLLTIAASITLHSSAAGLGIYLGTYIAFALPIRRSVPLVLVLILAIEVIPRLLSGQPPDFGTVQSIAMSSFAVGGIRQIIMRNRQLTLARKQLTELAVAEERLRVGRDVHDILGHSLTVITVKTELAQRLMDLDPERAKTEMADVERLAREALAGVRSTVGGLREVSLAGELVNARTALRAAEIDADLPDGDDLPTRNSVVFGWVLREAVTNVIRHSGARHCTVRVTPTSIDVTDDGVGFGDTPKLGSGLSGLRERLQAAGGDLTLTTGTDGGSRVLATFPAAHTQEHE